MTNSGGQTGSPNCHGQRAEWVDVSGPFTRAVGREEETFGIAMLDHPSNRNHPNAWFVRGYGPVGTNLPYFDGALTLQPGETWRARVELDWLTTASEIVEARQEIATMQEATEAHVHLRPLSGWSP